MKRLIVTILLIILPSLALAINVTNSAQKDQGAAITSALAYPGAVTIGSTLVACYRLSNGGSAISFSDSVNGSWTTEANTADANGNINGCAYKANTAAGTPTVTASWTGSVTFRWDVAEVTGAATVSPRDQYQNTAFNSSVTSMSSGAVTTGQNDEVIIGFALVDGATTWTLGSGYTKVQFVPDSSSGKQAMEFKVQTVAGSQNPDWTISSGTGVAGVITFKAPATASIVFTKPTLAFSNANLYVGNSNFYAK